MKWKLFLSLLAVLMLGLPVAAQDGITYDTYTSDDGRITFDVPEGWLVTPFGPAINLSTTGYVEMSDVQPGDQNVSIIMLDTAVLETSGISNDTSPDAYALAVLGFVSEGEEVPPVDESGISVITLDSGVEAGTFDLTVGEAGASVLVFRQDDLTLFVSSLAHESEFDAVKSIMMHITNSIEVSEGTGEAMSMTQFPVVPVVATDDAITLPEVPEDGVQSGVYTFTFTNSRTEAGYSPLLARLNEGVTMEDFTAAATTGDGMGAVALITMLGGPSVMPDETASATYELTPGDYMLIELSFEGPGDMQPFTVVEDESMEDAQMPSAAVQFTMVDFGFGIQDPIPAGELTWRIENAGEQWHEAAIFRVPEGTTVEDILSSMESGEGSDEEFAQVFTWLPMGAGVEAWTTVDLEPGTYAILCFLPDLAGDFAPHVAKGMVQVFTVE